MFGINLSNRKRESGVPGYASRGAAIAQWLRNPGNAEKDAAVKLD
jgi:hypothetical protein